MAKPPPRSDDAPKTESGIGAARVPGKVPGKVKETGGPTGPEPTRYGDWERGGRCIDF